MQMKVYVPAGSAGTEYGVVWPPWVRGWPLNRKSLGPPPGLRMAKLWGTPSWLVSATMKPLPAAALNEVCWNLMSWALSEMPPPPPPLAAAVAEALG